MSTENPIYERRWWTLGVLSLSVLVIAFAGTILNVAIPTLARDLHASASALEWIVDAYTLVFAATLLIFGWLGDRFGRKRLLTVGLALFGVGSGLSAVATSATQLIAFRAITGLGAAALMPATLSILAVVFPAPERGRAIGIWAGMTGLGLPLGPILGGWLLEHFAWGAVFMVNIPLVALTLVATRWLVPESRERDIQSPDPLGALLAVAGIGALLYAVIDAPTSGWTSATTLVAAAMGIALLVAFVVWELRVRSPMLDVRLFADSRFSAAVIALALLFFAMVGTLFVLTQYLQSVLGFSPLRAGFGLVPLALGLTLMAPLSSRVVDRVGVRAVIAGGLALAAAGVSLMALVTASTGYPLVGLSLALLGAGIGTASAPATTAIMGLLPLDQAGVGSAVNNAIRQLGGALGVAVLGSLISSGYRAGLSGAVTGLPRAASAAAGESLGAASQVAAALPHPQAAALTDAAHVAYIHAMNATALAATAAALAGVVIALVFLPRRARPARAVLAAEAA
jgi:EmrB/QacA subfamily drug resistance transporter